MAPALGSRPHTLPRPLPKSATVCQSNFERLPITAVLSLFHQALAQGWWIFKDSWPLTNRSVNCAGPLTQAFFFGLFPPQHTLHDPWWVEPAYATSQSQPANYKVMGRFSTLWRVRGTVPGSTVLNHCLLNKWAQEWCVITWICICKRKQLYFLDPVPGEMSRPPLRTLRFIGCFV